MDKKRKLITGTSISGGIVLGHARVVLPGDVDVAEVVIPASRVNIELESLETAIKTTISELRDLRDSADRKMGGPVAKIFDAQLLIAGDYEFLKQVKEEIKRRRRNAGFVYYNLVQNTTAPLKSSPEAYINQMASDIEAVAHRVLSHLSGFDKCDLKFPPNTILVGKTFTPGDVLSYRQRKVIGLMVSEGGKNSHMALIARALLLPVVLLKDAYLEIANDALIILDGSRGEAIINPTDQDWSKYQRLKKRQGPAQITRLKSLPGIPPQTADGKIVRVGANLTLPGPVDEILSKYDIPVGLYRTEYLYLSEGGFPDEEAQFHYYDDIAERYAKSSVVLRTFDLGYDKLAIDDIWPHEDNPALGWRGIRAMLDMTPIFRTQIRAILRASTRKNLKIMLPMVSDVSELEKAKKIVSQEKFKLRRQDIPFDDNIQIGVMIEVPSAAITAGALARKADFLSIGSNDLTQYTLAADRMNNRVANLYSVYHPSVVKLMNMTVEAARKQNKPVSVCGEVAGDPLAVALFIGMGIDLLSMTPARLFDLCRLVAKIDSGMARHLVTSVLASETQQDVVNKLQTYKAELEKRKPSSRRK